MSENIDRDLSGQFDRQLDRLVDGELASEEYRQLLAALDRSPDGWRRCALAFLESQAMRGDLAGLMDQSLNGHSSAINFPAAVSQSPAIASPSPSANAMKVSATSWKPLVLAASVILSFTLGAAISGRWNFDGNHSTADMAKTDPAKPDSSATLVAVTPQTASGKQPSGLQRGAANLAGPLSPELAHERESVPGSLLPANLQLVVDGGNGATESISVPTSTVAENNAHLLDPNWLAQQPSGMPNEVLRQLQRSGREVRRKIELMPVQASNGQWIVVPVEEVNIAPAMRKEMQ